MTGEPENGKLMHALSFDVEEHFQVTAFWSASRREQWDQLASRVERNTRKIIDLLEEHHASATFFVLGWVAERHPRLVKDLVRCGHEIASHGYGHELVSAQTPDQFREDIKRSKRILEDLSGKPVIGYRAPSFSITSQTEWALPILVEEGYRYDSSIYDRFRSTTAIAGSHTSYYHLDTSSGVLVEVSPSTMKVWGLHLPVAGGGYFRLLPYSATRLLLKKLEGQGSQLVMYLHPWELDPAQPRMEGSLVSKARHYLNLSKTEERLRRLLDDFSFGPVNEVVDPIQQLWRCQNEGQPVLV